MPRAPKPWKRPDQPDGPYYCWHAGQRVALSEDLDEAWRLLHRLKSGEDAAQVLSKRITVHELFDRWLDSAQRRRKPATYDFYKRLACKFLDHAGRNRPAEELIPHDLTVLVDARRDAGESGTSLNHLVTTIKAAFRWGRRQGLIDRDPMEFAERPERDTDEPRALTHDEQARLRGAIKTKPVYVQDAIVTLLETGARPQELRAIDAAHVRLPDAVWHWRAGEAPKGKKPRTVWLVGEPLGITARLVKTHPDGPLFRGRYDRPFTPNGLRCWLYKLGKETKIDGLESRWLRHTFATNALEAGVPAAYVSILLGHADLSMLSQVYGHLDARGDAVAKWASVANSASLGKSSGVAEKPSRARRDAPKSTDGRPTKGSAATRRRRRTENP